MKCTHRWLSIFLTSACLIGLASLDARAESPYIEDHYPNRVYFGDTHLHTSWSIDAGMVGATLGPDVAYLMAKGDVVASHLGWKENPIRPLDSLVVADHAKNLGLADFIRRSDPILLAQAKLGTASSTVARPDTGVLRDWHTCRFLANRPNLRVLCLMDNTVEGSGLHS